MDYRNLLELTQQALLKWSIRKGVELQVLNLKVKNKHGNRSNCVEDLTMKSQFPTLTPHILLSFWFRLPPLFKIKCLWLTLQPFLTLICHFLGQSLEDQTHLPSLLLKQVGRVPSGKQDIKRSLQRWFSQRNKKDKNQLGEMLNKYIF